jgi:hypothetical protein
MGFSVYFTVMFNIFHIVMPMVHTLDEDLYASLQRVLPFEAIDSVILCKIFHQSLIFHLCFFYTSLTYIVNSHQIRQQQYT